MYKEFVLPMIHVTVLQNMRENDVLNQVIIIIYCFCMYNCIYINIHVTLSHLGSKKTEGMYYTYSTPKTV